MSLDAKLISGLFDRDVPPEQHHLFKYFKSEMGRALVGYYFGFADLRKQSDSYFCECFVDHTGYYASIQRLRYLLKRIDRLVNGLKKAEEEFDLKTMERIKNGKFLRK